MYFAHPALHVCAYARDNKTVQRFVPLARTHTHANKPPFFFLNVNVL